MPIYLQISDNILQPALEKKYGTTKKLDDKESLSLIDVDLPRSRFMPTKQGGDCNQFFNTWHSGKSKEYYQALMSGLVLGEALIHTYIRNTNGTDLETPVVSAANYFDDDRVLHSVGISWYQGVRDEPLWLISIIKNPHLPPDERIITAFLSETFDKKTGLDIEKRKIDLSSDLQRLFFLALNSKEMEEHLSGFIKNFFDIAELDQAIYILDEQLEKLNKEINCLPDPIQIETTIHKLQSKIDQIQNKNSRIFKKHIIAIPLLFSGLALSAAASGVFYMGIMTATSPLGLAFIAAAGLVITAALLKMAWDTFYLPRLLTSLTANKNGLSTKTDNLPALIRAKSDDLLALTAKRNNFLANRDSLYEKTPAPFFPPVEPQELEKHTIQI